MAYNSKYTGQEVENLLDQIANGNIGGGGIGNIITCEFMGEVGDVIWSDDDQDRIDYIANWMEELSIGKVCVLDFDDYEGTYAMVHAINYRNDATYSIGKVIFSYVFEGYLYDVEYESVSLPVTLTIVNKTKVGGEGGSSAEPMVCAYRITSYTANHIELENYTHNGQTMNYREGAIILITNPSNEDVVFEGGTLTLTLDGNEYETNAFTLKSGATALFSLGVDPGVLFPVSSVVESNSGGSSDGGPSAYTEVNHGTSDTTFELTPNTFHIWGEMASLNLILGAKTSGVANEYLFQFTSGTIPTTLTLPDDIKFAEDLIIEANKIYQISILKGLGSVLSWDIEVEIDTTPIIFYINNENQFNAEAWMTWADFIASDYNTNIPSTYDKWFRIENGMPEGAILYEGEVDNYVSIIDTDNYTVVTSNDKIKNNCNYMVS